VRAPLSGRVGARNLCLADPKEIGLTRRNDARFWTKQETIVKKKERRNINRVTNGSALFNSLLGLSDILERLRL